MHRALTIAFFIASFSLSTFALSNQECVEVYRDGYLDLRESIEEYNDKRLDKHGFAAEVSAQTAAVKTLRAACYFTESPDVSSCVEDYKELYQDLRDKVRVRSVLAGNQDYINYSDASSSKPGIIGRFFNSGADVVKLGKLGIIDARCL